MKPIERLSFEIDTLMTAHPPRLHSRHKQLVYEIACPPGTTHSGDLGYARWSEMPLPDRVTSTLALDRAEVREDIYDYVPVLQAPRATEWHVNFADANLFVAYGSDLFAQDEMQVAEHPVLGALLEALVVAKVTARTEVGGRPTPVTVRGAQRRCVVDTDPNEAEDRPYGLYGNAFSAAPLDAIRRATRRIDPPTTTHLLAMAAPAGGYGPYEASEIRDILTTAFTGFRAALLESDRGPVAVHTGFWGCGAFGGHRVLMAALQVLAAEMAGLERLVFHTVNSAGSQAFDDARTWVAEHLGSAPIGTDELVSRIEAAGFEWGESDGN